MCLLHLGGPVFCKGDLQSNYTFGRNVRPSINLTLCGVPPPNVTWSFHGKDGIAKRDITDYYRYEYFVQLPQLTQETCGRNLALNLTGHSSIVKELQLLLDSCEY